VQSAFLTQPWLIADTSDQCIAIFLPVGTSNTAYVGGSPPGSDFTVDSTGDGSDSNFADGRCDDGTGHCTLRAAIQQANHSPGANRIRFGIGTGARTIAPLSLLPTITEAVTIDGTTQPGFAGKPLIELSGTAVGVNRRAGFDGLSIKGGNTTVRGLAISGFTANGSTELVTGEIRLDKADHNIIEGNFIGTDITGTVKLNNFAGIEVDESRRNIIGGTTTAARNITSGSIYGDIVIDDQNTSGEENLVQGNFVGTDVTGTVAFSNLSGGIQMFSSRNCTVGGTVPGARNLISGNSRGLTIFQSSGTLIQGNLIGTDISGTLALGNSNGIVVTATANTLIGGTTPAAHNIISGNRNFGVGLGVGSESFSVIGGTGALVEGNYIGVDVNGTVPLGNGSDGIFIEVESFAHSISANIIAFNERNGINIPNLTNSVGKPGFRITILSNSIFSNRALGIELGNDGVTSNDFQDPDTGANLQQNFPVLNTASALLRSSTINAEVVPHATFTVSGTFPSTPNQRFTLQFFFGSGCDASGHQFTGALPVTLEPPLVVDTDANGNAPFTYTFTIPGSNTGGYVNATATSFDGNTSEPSSCLQVGIVGPTISNVQKEGKHFVITGTGFVQGAKVLVNGVEKKAIEVTATQLTGKKAAKGAQLPAKIQVRNPDGSLSNEWTYP
jgi:CSLREA domain-containing protein